MRTKTLAEPARPSLGPAKSEALTGSLHVLLITLVVLAVIIATSVGTIAASEHGHRAHRASALVPTLPSMTTVVTINGQAVPIGEFELFLEQDRAATYAYFQQAFGVGASKNFWATAVHGTTPTAYLKKLALSDVARTLVKQQWAQQLGAAPDESYAAFVAAWRAENARRAKAVKARAVIYGPQQYSESNYFTVVTAQTELALKQSLVSHGAVDTTDAALHTYFLAHRGDFSSFDSGGSLALPGSQTAVAATFAAAKSQVEQEYVNVWYQQSLDVKVAAAMVRVVEPAFAEVSVG